ncbi:selenium binding protein [Enterococcus casseliflavus]|uniref:Selenium binding protein n=1 Tax=Enterococcus casseliflavus TaxID=37734 RepID=A0A415EJ47_ENTCA|nr:selenium binding protein [Enterococcus casseliflavus]MBE9908835.1 selenium binding protein [Enterococcus casseliflavus]RHK01606.1 selenium binding protein [Enterococcus casseliflavus]
MYESYSRQALPSTKYRELLGSALCVFNSNNAFIIENILNHDVGNYSWHYLIDRTSGKLSGPIQETITRVSDTKIAEKFNDLIEVRNRIIHGFQVTHQGEQILATKDRSNKQYIITEEYLLGFIKDNEELTDLLHSFRGN